MKRTMVTSGWDVEETTFVFPCQTDILHAEHEETASLGVQKYGRSPGKCEGPEHILVSVKGLYFGSVAGNGARVRNGTYVVGSLIRPAV